MGAQPVIHQTGEPDAHRPVRPLAHFRTANAWTKGWRVTTTNFGPSAGIPDATYPPSA
jgi:hypothetical protein